MKLRALFSIALSGVFTISCSDFTNSAKSSNSSKQSPADVVSKPGSTLPPELQNPNVGPFSEAKMLVNIGMNVQYPAVVNLNTQARLMQSKVRRYCEALKKNESVRRAEEGAQDQFKETMLSYHFVDAANAGPLTNRGRWLADNIYSWPYIDQCGIDRSVVNYAKTGVADTSIFHTAKGLGAIEYLLFEKSLVSKCNLRANPDVKSWNAKPADEKMLERCEVAAALSSDLVSMTTQLEDDWNPSKGNYTVRMIDNTIHENLNASTNALVDSLFIGIEKVKDARLGKPLGRHKECLNDNKKCPEMSEHALSGLGVQAVAAQVAGFKAVWTGDYESVSGIGLEDFVRQQGRSEVADTMNAYISDSLKTADIISSEKSLVEMIDEMDSAQCLATTKSDRRVDVCAFHADVREVANLLKIEVFSILSLRLPSFGQGDND